MTETIWWSTLPTPYGDLGFASSSQGLLTLLFPNAIEDRDRVIARLAPGSRIKAGDEENAVPVRQVREYLAGERKVFDMPLDQRGTAFQRDVWNAVFAIPWGETTTYGEIARRIGRPDAVRAVGAANGANPIPIIVPCHRVIGSDGSLTGFGGGLPLKRQLLSLEGVPEQRTLDLGV
ncbi:MAG: methylated-DNA--[protein]-cysteine S-methyltransferase [Thermomicrobiales bacterium]